LEDLPPADQSVVVEPIRRGLRNPSFVGSPNAIGEEMRLSTEDAVEVEGDGHVAVFRRSERWWRRRESGGG
jgi:hypothetical protein